MKVQYQFFIFYVKKTAVILFLTSCYLSKVLLTFDLTFLAFLINYFLTNSVKLCGFKFKHFSIQLSFDFIFAQDYFQKPLNSWDESSISIFHFLCKENCSDIIFDVMLFVQSIINI